MRMFVKKESTDLMVNGEKICACGLCGLRRQGRNAGTKKSTGLHDATTGLLVDRRTLEKSPSGAFQVESHLQTSGHTASSGPHVRFINLHIPKNGQIKVIRAGVRGEDLLLGGSREEC